MEQDLKAEILRLVPVRAARARPAGTGGSGWVGLCDNPWERISFEWSVGPQPNAPISCQIDAPAIVEITALPGHTRKPITAGILCYGEGPGWVVVGTTSPQTVMPAAGVTVVLDGDLDVSIPVAGGWSYPINLRVDVENANGAAGRYSISYVLTVELT